MAQDALFPGSWAMVESTLSSQSGRVNTQLTERARACDSQG